MPPLSSRIGAIIFAATMLAGCAATSALEPQHQPLASRNARIYVLRPPATVAVALPAGVKVNGSEVGAVANNSYLSVDRPPGRYKVEVASPTLLGSSEVEVQVEAGHSYYFALNMATMTAGGVRFISSSSGQPVGQSGLLSGSSLGQLDASAGAAMLARLKPPK